MAARIRPLTWCILAALFRPIPIGAHAEECGARDGLISLGSQTRSVGYPFGYPRRERGRSRSVIPVARSRLIGVPNFRELEPSLSVDPCSGRPAEGGMSPGDCRQTLRADCRPPRFGGRARRVATRRVPGMRSSSAPSVCSACHTSKACCIPSHSAGPLPAHFPSRTAISGVTGALPARIRCRSCRDTPSSRAACETFIRNAGSTSSRRISPGWVGSRFNGCRTGSTFLVVVFVVTIVVAFRSVILLESQLAGVLAVPAERDAPRATDGHRVPALSIALQWVHTPARHVQV